MASKKKESEGIALLSMYNDEDDEEMEDLEEEEEYSIQQQPPQQHEREFEQNEYREATNMEEDLRNDAMVAGDFTRDHTPGVPSQNSTPKEGLLRPLTPQQQQQVAFSSSPQQQQQQQQRGVSSSMGRGRGRLAIVDYGHDEVAMSPEPEEGEIGTSDQIMFNEELVTANGDVQENTPSGAVEVLTPSLQGTSQSSGHLEPSHPDMMNPTSIESEGAELDGATKVSVESVDPLDKFLPPPPKATCPEELQRKIDKFLALKKIGKSFNAEVRNRKDYRNPDFLLHAVRYQDIDQIGSCFGKDVFDPHGYDKSDFYDEIEADMRREKERKEQELKRSPKVEFVSVGTQPGTVAAAPKLSLPLPGVSAVVPSGLHSLPAAADTVTRDGRQNKKSKWDKVDGDRRNPLPSSGQDVVSTMGAHAALLTAANAGAGYTAFAQQRRREAEEKRSSERRLERRS